MAPAGEGKYLETAEYVSLRAVFTPPLAMNTGPGLYTPGSHSLRGRGLGEGRGPGGVSPGGVFEEQATFEITTKAPVLYKKISVYLFVCLSVQKL